MDAAASGGRRDPEDHAQAKPPDETFAADGEVVWSWRRDPGATLARSIALTTGARKAASPGRARISRKTIARGKPGCLGCTCSLTRVLFGSTLAHGTAGASSARLSLRPLSERGTTKLHNPGENELRERVRMSVTVIARSEADEAIQLSCWAANEAGLLRGACHRARVRATRWLAMTAMGCLTI